MRKFQSIVWLLTLAILTACSNGSDSNGNGDPTLSISDASVSEGDSGNSNLTFTISLSKTVSSAVTVDYATSGGSATEGSDYTAISGTATIPAGSTSTTITVAVIGDTDIEGNETFTLTLSNPSGANLLTASATGTITDDDSPPAVPDLSTNNSSITEGDSGTVNLTFTLNLSMASGSDVTVDYVTSDVNTTAGTDYTIASGTATITAGNTSTTVSVMVNGDTDVEPDETFTFTLSNASGANLITTSVIGTILNDDAGAGGPYMMYNYPSNLYAVDMTDPTQKVFIGAIDIGSDEAEMIYTGDINIANQSLENPRPHTFVYYDAGSFWRLDASAGSSLTPIQISSASVAYVCYMDVLDNIVSPDDSYIIYTAGPDSNTCLSNGQHYSIRVGDDNTVTPTSLSGILSTTTDVANNVRLIQSTPGVVAGFLVTHTADVTVTRYDQSFTNPATIFPASSFLADRDGGDLSIDATFFHVDGVLHVYTHNMSSTATTVMHTAVAGRSFDDTPDSDFICNTTHCYFAEIDNGGVQTVIMAAIDGSGSSEINTFTSENVLKLILTDGRLYINTVPKAGGGQSLYAASVAGGAVTEVEGPLPDQDYFLGMLGVGENFYYSVVDASLDTISAKVMQDNNNIPVGPIPNANWIGSQYFRAQAGTLFLPSTILLGEEVSTPNAGLKLTVYDTATATVMNEMGTIEGAFFGGGTYSFLGTVGFSIGSQFLGRAIIGTSTNFQADMFYFDSSIANSLYRVTNTSAINEGNI